ncbi:hypothetical protein MKUB_14650 [Mycobacterium kubicae]|uniref:Putative amidase domain-containing protein n=1 Tax=Mycobacterium kubicae TaxID=120959 RepID=A0ABQ1BJS9_9MYCO|nr:amidase domain-containing protein [Mycobacterium kubicae]ORW04527.1 hypothetical protein AWC13_00560 [Mycobacterium kubicae]QNI11178.1 amidase [Mycobacterium kubicae]GFG63975.1 hypothetical protein MKUB_14650 [Mycobacterium kubicae]
MVTFAQLRDAHPALWQTAADDLLAVAKQSERTAGNIHANGAKPLEEHWPDHTGTLARNVLVQVAGRMVNTGVLARGATTPLDTLQDAVEIAQRELNAAVSEATAKGFSVGDDGRVSLPTASVDPVGDLMTALRYQQRIADAVEAATQADQLCADALSAVSLNPDDITSEQAQNAQGVAVRKAVEEMRDQLPDGLTPEEVGKWWAALTPQQQLQLRLAAPVELYDLPGIPAEVKAQLTNGGNGYNPIEAVRWAYANAPNEGLNRFPNNCALFVSESLRAGGLSEVEGRWSKEDWANPIPNIPSVHIPFSDRNFDADQYRYTKSWYNADEQRSFLVNSGGSAVPLSQTRPGDVIYFNWTDSAAHSGEVSHHAAIVSSVLPNGEVLYTQHTPGAVNYSLEDRLPIRLQDQDPQSVVVIRPPGVQ